MRRIHLNLDREGVLLLVAAVVLTALVFALMLAGIASAATDPTKYGHKLYELGIANLKWIWLIVMAFLWVGVLSSRTTRQSGALGSLGLITVVSFVAVWRVEDVAKALDSITSYIL